MKPGQRPEDRNKIDFRRRQRESTVHIRHFRQIKDRTHFTTEL